MWRHVLKGTAAAPTPQAETATRWCRSRRRPPSALRRRSLGSRGGRPLFQDDSVRVFAKLTAATLLSAVLPFSASLYQSVGLHERALRRSLHREHETSAALASNATRDYFGHIRASLRTLIGETIDWQALSPAEREGALWLAHGQFKSVAVAELRSGAAVVQAVALREPDPDDPARPALAPEDWAAFDAAVPPAGGELQIGAPVRLRGGALIAPLVLDLGQQQRGLNVALGIALDALCERIAQGAPAEGDVRLLDATGRQVCHGAKVAKLENAPVSLGRLLHSSDESYEREQSGERLHGVAIAVLEGWHLVVEQPAEVIARLTRSLRNRALLWLGIGAAAAVATGLWVAYSIKRPLERLMLGVKAIAAGNLEFRLDTTGRDEFGRLATAFNRMSGEIAERDREIQDWNTELKARVDQRSRQLEEAQEALLRSQKMAGLAALTAGMAHEMNNPLTGILGLTQVLAARVKKRPDQAQEQKVLDSIIVEAERMRRLLSEMSSLGQLGGQEGFQEVRVQPLVESVVLSERSEAESREVELQVDCQDDGSRVFGDQKLLSRALAALVDNALTAAPAQGGIIKVATECPKESWVKITVEDNGRGIDKEHLEKVFEPFYTTKQGGGEGLGLAQVYQTVQAHGGRIELHSQSGQGTQLEIFLPTMGIGAHLV